ncbi:HIBCH protein, partial [Acromyrmex insinuator]
LCIKIIHKKVGDKSVIILNRPKELCHKFIHDPKNMVYSILNQWEFSKKLVIIEGTSEKAFCAGGDVKSLVLALNETKDLYLIEETFRQGYIVDVLFAGIATHFVPSEKLTDLKRDLLTLREVDIKSVLTVLNKHQLKLNHKFSLASHISQIENCFSGPTIEKIIEKLGTKNIDVLFKMSPSSLKITKRAIDEGKEKSLTDCLNIKFRLVCTALIRDDDFYKGNKIEFNVCFSNSLLGSIFQFNCRCQSSLNRQRSETIMEASLPDVTNEYLNKRFAVLPVKKALQLCTRKL